MEEEKTIKYAQANKRRVVTHKNLPTRLPFWQTIVVILAFREFPPQTNLGFAMWGFVFTVMAFSWVVSLINITSEQRIDIFERLDTLAKRELAENMNKIFSNMANRHKERRNDIRR